MNTHTQKHSHTHTHTYTHTHTNACERPITNKKNKKTKIQRNRTINCRSAKRSNQLQNSGTNASVKHAMAANGSHARGCRKKATTIQKVTADKAAIPRQLKNMCCIHGADKNGSNANTLGGYSCSSCDVRESRYVGAAYVSMSARNAVADNQDGRGAGHDTTGGGVRGSVGVWSVAVRM